MSSHRKSVITGRILIFLQCKELHSFFMHTNRTTQSNFERRFTGNIYSSSEWNWNGVAATYIHMK